MQFTHQLTVVCIQNCMNLISVYGLLQQKIFIREESRVGRHEHGRREHGTCSERNVHLECTSWKKRDWNARKSSEKAHWISTPYSIRKVAGLVNDWLSSRTSEEHQMLSRK